MLSSLHDGDVFVEFMMMDEPEPEPEPTLKFESIRQKTHRQTDRTSLHTTKYSA